jgi:prevent-host-death family protein
MRKTIIGLRELRENIGTYISEVKKGRSFVVVKRSKPIFKISPAENESGLWEEVIDFTKIRKGGVNIQAILSRL